MEFFYMLAGSLFSPVELAICFVIILYANGKFWSVPLAAAAATLSSVLLPSNVPGERAFWYSLLACVIQSFVIYGLILLKKKFFKKQ